MLVEQLPTNILELIGAAGAVCEGLSRHIRNVYQFNSHGEQQEHKPGCAMKRGAYGSDWTN